MFSLLFGSVSVCSRGFHDDHADDDDGGWDAVADGHVLPHWGADGVENLIVMREDLGQKLRIILRILVHEYTY